MPTIRQATPADIPLIHELAWQAFPATYRHLLSPEQSDYMMEWMYSHESLHQQMEAGHVYFILYSDEDRPCGYLSVQKEGDNVYHLQKIYLLPDVQKRHYGSFLFRHALSYIKSIHPSPCQMRLNVNRDNIKAVEFYKRMGMKQIDRGDFPIGKGFYMTDYIMSIDLR